MLRIHVTQSHHGLVFTHDRRRYNLNWPKGLWRKLPKGFRAVLTDHLAHLLTIDVPLVAGADGVELNRPRPCFQAQLKTMSLGSIPQAIEAYPPATTKVLERFRGARRGDAGRRVHGN